MFDRLQWLKANWTPLLWGALLIGLTLNALYLMWPQAPETLSIHPHPATLRQYAQPLPVLVDATPQPQDKDYKVLSADDVAAVSKAEHVASIHTRRKGSHAAHPKKKTFNGTLNLNTATADQLQQFPGIGPKMAIRILDYRKSIGKFKTVEQLMEVSGIGPKKYAKIAPHCSL